MFHINLEQYLLDMVTFMRYNHNVSVTLELDRRCAVKERHINILRYLLNHPGYITAEILADLSHVSTKTVYKDVHFINEYLDRFEVEIEKKPRYGLTIDVESQKRTSILNHLVEMQVKDKLQEIYLYNRELIILKRLTMSEIIADPLQLSMELFISESTLQKDLERLKVFAQKYDVKIQMFDKRLEVVGHERDIRAFVRQMVVQQLNLNDQNMPFHVLNELFNCNFEQIASEIEKLETRYHLSISNYYKYSLMLDVAVALNRVHLGKRINSSDTNILHDIEKYEVYLFANDLVTSMNNHEKGIFSVNEIKYIAESVLAVGYHLEQVLDSNEIRELVETVINEINRLIGIDLTNDEHLKKMVISHVPAMIFRLKNHISISNPLTERIKVQYSVLYNFLWIATKQLAEHYHLKMNDAEIAFLTIHFEIAIEKQAKPMMIYVICPHHLAISELIISQLKKIIPGFDRVVSVKESELANIKLNSNDLVISTIKLSKDIGSYILVNGILTSQQLEMVQKYYLKASEGNRQMSTILGDTEMGVAILLKDLIRDSIYLKKRFKSKEDCLEFLINESHPKNRSNNHYKTSIYEREETGITSIQSGVALPHANPEFVQTSQLIIATCDKPIKWGTNMVNVVILIAVDSQELEIYRDALIKIYSNIDDPEHIKILSESRSFEGFMRLLLQD